jgi:hypothetical protein
MRWVERTAPGWAMLVTPWGASLALHSVFLLLLAVYFYVYVGQDQKASGHTIDTAFAEQLTDDVTSLAPAQQAGDPFTTVDTTEPPSLSLQPVTADTTRINVPKLPPSMLLGANLRLTAIDSVANSGKKSEGIAELGVSVGPASAPFSGRQGDVKAKLVRREGGTTESEKAVERGLDWLARHQRGDGSWGLDTRGQCSGTGCPEDESDVSDTAATGLALLPLLGAGMTHTEAGRYQDNIKRGLSWLLKHQRAEGDLFTGGGRTTHLYSHAIGAMALCEAYGVSKDKRLRDPAQKAINYIINSQNKFDGGWRYEPGTPGDTSVFGWQIFALRSARLAGLSVPKATLRRCRTYLDSAAADDLKATYSYMPGREASQVMTAEALLSRQILGWARDYPPMLQGAAIVSANLDSSQERNIYYWYYATQLLHNLQGKDWERWNKRVRDGLVDMQVSGTGCDRGSWDPLNPQPDAWGKSAGRLYVTSLSLLTLEVYYRYLPLYRAGTTKMEGTEEEETVQAAAGDAEAKKTATEPPKSAAGEAAAKKTATESPKTSSPKRGH